MPTRDQLLAAGMDPAHIVDRATHPAWHASSWPTTGRGHELLGGKARYHLPHISPQSVLITVASNLWEPGCWHRLQDMVRRTERAGYTVALEEVDDMSLMPYDAIGIMRSCAATLALDAGVEWSFMVDTDAMLEPDTLVRLLEHDRPIVYPYLTTQHDVIAGLPLSSPRLQPHTGLQPVTWAAMSVMLFNVKVFNCLPPFAWWGHDYHFAQCLGHYGHRIYVDTDTVVETTKGPARNLGKSWESLWERFREVFDRIRFQDRDRGAPPGFDSVFGEGAIDKDGVYWALDQWSRHGMNGPQSHGGNHDSH